MIKREHIKQAIDAIASRNPDIGYTLDEMLGIGLIDTPSRSDDLPEGQDFCFLFDGEKVLVNKVLFFNQGTVPIEQGLLIKYGELVKKQEIQDKGGSAGYKDVYREIHAAGLRLVVIHEIDFAIARLSKRRGSDPLIALLEGVKKETESLDLNLDGIDPFVMYRGVVDDDRPAYFICFPMCMASLMQVGDMNVEFFSVRFILGCLIKGLQKNLMACVVERHIVGLIFLALKKKVFKRDLEIKFFATLRGKTWDSSWPASRPPRGVGIFLVAGVWLLWKNRMPGFKEVVLDSEVGARTFYDRVGFEPRGLSGYVLKEPKGSLLKAILGMAQNARDLKQEVIQEIAALVRKKVKKLRKKAKGQRAIKERKAVIAAMKECLKAGARPEFAEAALEAMTKYQKKIPESKEILNLVTEGSAGEGMEHATTSYR
ncbi:MAG: hypothetical protein MUO52_19775 [Desulfobacterales bacterium]|nr:hypothetical protein [Desulfobacterales bacterium]